LPTDLLLSALTIASWNGVTVEIIVPGRRDNKDFIIHMNRTNYQRLLDTKCKVYEYNGFIHSKYIVVDDQFVLTGSSNLDFRSLWINFENALLVDNQQFAKQMSRCFEDEKNNSIVVTQDLINCERTIKTKIKDLILSTYKPLL
jgi:cardiolipin synthase